MSLKEISRMSLVCHNWRNVASDPVIWRGAIRRFHSRSIQTEKTVTVTDLDGTITTCSVVMLKPDLRMAIMGPVPLEVGEENDAVKPSQFTTWKQVYMLLYQIKVSERCQCSAKFNCRCGWTGLDPWQLEFLTSGLSNAFLLLRDATYRQTFPMVQERLARNGYQLKDQNAPQDCTSELLMRRLASEGAGMFRYWRLKPSPNAVKTPHLDERLNHESLRYHITMDLLEASQAALSWPELRFCPHIRVGNLELRCGDATEKDGIKIHAWGDGFTVEFTTAGGESVRFGTVYGLLETGKEIPFHEFNLPACDAAKELEVLSISPASLVEVTARRYQELLDDYAEQHRLLQEPRHQRSFLFEATHSLLEWLARVIRFRETSPPALSSVPQSISPMEEPVRRALSFIQKHKQTIHGQLLRLLPPQIQIRLFNREANIESTT